MKYIFTLLIALLSFFSITHTSFAAIDFDVTPIKYELDVEPGESITLPATLTNKGPDSFTITTGKSDFEPTGNTGAPRFVRYSELVHPDQQISTWISLSTPGFTIPAASSETINFTIDVPTNATPGGHYGAIFFKNGSSETSQGGNIGINVDYGILILVNVAGDINSSGSVAPISIGNSGTVEYDRCEGTDTSGSIYDGLCSEGEVSIVDDGIDDCLIDFTPSNFDGKCFENPFDTSEKDNNITNSPGENTDNTNQNTQSGSEQNGDEGINNQGENNSEQDFNIVFDIPFENEGNTHIKPEGSIFIIDEDGNVIEQIGEKLIKNERGAVIGKEIVDYLPINDEEGNVLPSSVRNFSYEWRGFPYKDINGEIAYRQPGEYYTLTNETNAQFLMFWERVCERKQNKTLTADIGVSYTNHEGKEIEFNSAQEFKIQYIEQYIGVNPYVVFPILLVLIIWILWWWFILAFKRKRCINKDCERRIKKKAKVCPYCETIQDKKKYKTQKTAAAKKKKTKTKKK